MTCILTSAQSLTLGMVPSGAPYWQGNCTQLQNHGRVSGDRFAGQNKEIIGPEVIKEAPGESGMETRDPCLPLRGILSCGVFRTMNRVASAPSCSAFIHRVALEEVSGHWVLIKSKTEKSGSFAFHGIFQARVLE